jgi:adenosine deaminase
MATLHLAELIDHPLLGTWLAEDYPLSICTDDSGIFNVTLSDELELVQRTYSLSDEKIGALSLASFGVAFAGWGDDEGGKQIMSELRHCAAETIREILQG